MSAASRICVPALCSIVFWGSSFVATRVALTWLSPFALVAARLWLGFATMVVLGRWLWPGHSLRRQDRARCILLGIILAAHLLLQNVGLLRTTATNTGWIIGFIPTAIALGAVLFLHERLTLRGWLGIGLGALGVLVVSLSTGMRFDDAKIGDLLQFTSCITWTAFTLVSVRPIRESGATVVTTWTIGVAALATTAATAAGGAGIATYAPGPLVALLFLGVICSGVAYALWNHAVRTIGSPATGAYLYLEPFVTLLAAQLVLDEPFNAVGLAGGVIVLVGVWMATGARRRTGP